MVCLLFVLMPGAGHAADKAVQRGVRLPLSYDAYDAKMGPRVASRRAEWWRVYAAKDGVPVYADRTGVRLAPHAELSFLESFCVLTEDKEAKRLELCRTSSEMASTTLVVDEVVGWVDTSDLVLSSQPYRTPHLVSRKVFVVNDWREFKVPNQEEFREMKVVARAAPSATGREVSKVTGLDSRFSFVYRWDRPDESWGWALIGTRRYIPDGRPQDCIVGWVPRNRLGEWNTRMALEPDPSRTTRADIYAKQAQAQGAYTGAPSQPLFGDPMSKKSMPASAWRYPILTDQRPGDAIAHVGWQGGLQVVGESGQRDSGVLESRAARVKSRVSHVNVIFVVDATSSMGPYLQAVSRASREIMKSAPQFKHTDMKLRFGAVVYRDMANTPPVDQKALTPNIQEVNSFLDSQKEPAAGDADYPEALFAGLEGALSLARANETNVLILIGDAGNNDAKGALSPRLLQLIKETDPILEVIWLRRPPRGAEESQAISAFETDLKERIFPVIEAQSDSLREVIKDAKPNVAFPSRTNLRETSPNIEDISNAEAYTRELLKNVISFNSAMILQLPNAFSGSEWDAIVPETPGATESAGVIGEEATPFMVDAAVLRELAKEAQSPEDFEFLIKDKVQLFQPGWVLLNDSQGRSVTRPVQLVSKQDLTDCRNQLLRLFEPGQSNREALQDAWQQIAENIPGEKPETPMEWIQLQYGIPFREMSPFLSTTYESIQTMSDDEFTQMLEAARSAIVRLEDVEQRPIWFTMLDQSFAWVPLADMP
jgi:hypothetical protein